MSAINAEIRKETSDRSGPVDICPISSVLRIKRQLTKYSPENEMFVSVQGYYMEIKNDVEIFAGKTMLTAFQRIAETVAISGIPFTIHVHEATRTVEEAERNLSFDVTRIVKTVAFRTRNGGIILAAVRGIWRVDYAGLSALLGINRRDLAALSPEEVVESLGIEPGSVSPVALSDDVLILIDEDVLTILPTLYCGAGRSDRTLEIAPDDLVRLTGARIGRFSREK